MWWTSTLLTLHPEKTRIVAMTEAGRHFEFLGYKFWRGKNGKLKRYVRHKSVKKLRERLKPLTKRNNGRCLTAIIGTLNRILRGWYGYFKHASGDALGDIDGWIRGRLRSILRKRHKRKGRARGRDHHRWQTRYFDTLGLFNLKRAQFAQSTSL